MLIFLTIHDVLRTNFELLAEDVFHDEVKSEQVSGENFVNPHEHHDVHELSLSMLHDLNLESIQK
ncbi:hypothetical protein [Peribacillus simplex]|uniref:hypothetical protein n=1 Tax=Peribacillus simplex TaxID=1478 RepID=UPI003D2A4C56